MSLKYEPVTREPKREDQVWNCKEQYGQNTNFQLRRLGKPYTNPTTKTRNLTPETRNPTRHPKSETLRVTRNPTRE